MPIRRRINISLLSLIIWVTTTTLALLWLSLDMFGRFRMVSEQTVEAVIALEQFQIASLQITSLAFSTQVGDRDLAERIALIDIYAMQAQTALAYHHAIEHAEEDAQSQMEIEAENAESDLLDTLLTEIEQTSRGLVAAKMVTPINIQERDRLNIELIELSDRFMRETGELVEEEREALNEARQFTGDTTNRILASLIVVYIGTVLGALWSAWELGKRIVQPIEQLRELAASLSKQNFDVPVHPERYEGELKALAEAFQDMMLRLKADIKHREEVEQELRQQELFLETVINSNPSRIFVRDAKGQYLLANIAHGQAYNITPQEIVGKTDFDLHNNPDEARRYQAEDRLLLQSGEVTFHTEEEVYDFGAGETRWMNIIKVPMMGREGTFDRMLCVMTDVTQLVQTSEALERARDEAEEASRLKSEFLATMSHELRTPLNAVIGFSGIMLEGMGGEIDEAARSMVQAIYSSSTNLLAIINDILDIAKIEAGRMELVIAPFNVQEMANALHHQTRVLADNKAIGYTVWVEDSVPAMLQGDIGRINQIAINLISNAIKFTDEGEVRVTFDWQEEQFKLTVTDTGAGIAPHAQTYIFDQFRQVDGTSRRKHGGTGLGLAIVRKLVEAMDGQITLKSKLHEGSTFTVTLPLQQDDTSV